MQIRTVRGITHYLCHIQCDKGRKAEDFWRAEAWPRAGDSMQGDGTMNSSSEWSAPASWVSCTLSIFSSSTASAVTGILNPSKMQWIMYYLKGRESTISEFDKLLYASCFVANFSMLLFPILHLYNFAKEQTEPKKWSQNLWDCIRTGSWLSSASSECSAEVRWWPETARGKPRKCHRFAMLLLDYRLLGWTVCMKRVTASGRWRIWKLSSS